MWGTVALGGPRVGRRAGEVPYTPLSDGVGEGEDVIVDGGAVGFSGDEHEGALQVDPM